MQNNPVEPSVVDDSLASPATRFRVWWCPQMPMKAFEWAVPNYSDGLRLCECLGAYDAFQFENNVKPDYCNSGGVVWSHPELTHGEWWDIDGDEAEELGFLDDTNQEAGGGT